MIYVALLRGINVGSKTKVEMARLKAVFEAVGCYGVSTYINSGNVIFTDGRPASELVPLLEAAIEKEFGFSVPVLLRDRSAIDKVCKGVPAEWTNDGDQKTDVLFLWEDVNDASISKKVAYDPKIEHVMFLDGAIVWNVARKHTQPGSTIKALDKNLPKYLTVRNINTVRKLYDLMSR